MDKKTLSVITPNFNHAKYLPQAIEAVINQSRPPDEYLILDDKSTDNSISVVEEYGHKVPFLRLLKNSNNLGSGKSTQRLINEATGDYVYCGASDDYILPGFFEKAMGMANLHPEAGIIFGKIVLIDENDKEIDISDVSGWTKAEYISPSRYLHEYLETHPINHSLCGATVFKRSCLLEIGGFRTELDSWGDTFASRGIALKYGACYIPQKVMTWRVLSNSVSNINSRKSRQLLKYIIRAAHLMRSAEFRDRFPEYYVHTFEKKYKRFIFFNDFFNKFLEKTGPIGKYSKKIFKKILSMKNQSGRFSETS